MRISLFATAIAFGLIFVICGCSQENREEAAERMSAARKALRGDIREDDFAREPRIVAEQRRKERFRQDTKWTPENQALHPIEYCQAQLEALRGYAQSLDVERHKCAVAKTKAKRGIDDAEGQLADISRFLDDAKSAYREAESSGHWPVTIGGFALSKARAQAKIVEVAGRRPLLHGVIARNKNMITSLDRKAWRISEEQQKVVRIKERTQLTLDGLKLKKIIDGDSDIVNALNAINDALGSIGIDYEDPSVDELVIPDRGVATKEAFDDIMSEK